MFQETVTHTLNHFKGEKTETLVETAPATNSGVSYQAAGFRSYSKELSSSEASRLLKMVDSSILNTDNWLGE